jgi:hypothetical protein
MGTHRAAAVDSGRLAGKDSFPVSYMHFFASCRRGLLPPINFKQFLSVLSVALNLFSVVPSCSV